jgi:GntR family transcriptional regulator, transcriptional repressor for pyruvate dehydrogenase complex
VSLQKTNLSDHVVEEIKGRLMRGELKEGDRLPSHDLLSKELGVSRSTLREGLKNLTLMGILEMKPGQGTRIKSLSPSSLMHNLAPSLLMDRATVSELMDARLVVELGTVSLACKSSDPSDIEEMERIIRQMEGYLQTKDYAGYSDLDLRFHFLMGHASKNKVLQRILEDIRGLLSQLLREVVLYLPGMAEKGNRYHKQILKALRDKDPKLADKAIRSHIASVAAAVQKYQAMKSA